MEAHPEKQVLVRLGMLFILLTIPLSGPSRKNRLRNRRVLPQMALILEYSQTLSPAVQLPEQSKTPFGPFVTKLLRNPPSNWKNGGGGPLNNLGWTLQPRSSGRQSLHQHSPWLRNSGA